MDQKTRRHDCRASASEGVVEIYVHTLTVSADDIDMLGHASNIAIVRWVQDTAVAHSAAVGLDFEAYAALRAVFVLRRHEIDYLRSAYLGESVVVRTWLEAALGASCIRAMEFYREDVLIAKSRTTWAWIDTVAQRPTRIPEAVRLAFGQTARKSKVRAPEQTSD